MKKRNKRLPPPKNYREAIEYIKHIVTVWENFTNYHPAITKALKIIIEEDKNLNEYTDL